MQENNSQTPAATSPNDAERFGNVPHVAETFGSVPKGSETFRTMRNDSASFRTVPNASERKQNHTLTVREAARMFEAAGVARTERSITNWCQPNKLGVSRLDAYFDPNERKYYITPESIDRAIEEEKAKAVKGEPASEGNGPFPKASEPKASTSNDRGNADTERTNELEKEILDLKILNGGKDYLINQLRTEREGLIKQVIDSSRQVGQLETQLRQLSAPRDGSEEEARGNLT